MDGQLFDDLVRSLGVSLHRKRFVATVAGLLGAGAVLERGAAKRKRLKGKRGNSVQVQGDGGFCGAVCDDESDCLNCPNAVCAFAQGAQQGECGCKSDITCTGEDRCQGPGTFCLCYQNICTCFDDGGTCVPTCAGSCSKDSDCPDLSGCVCDLDEEECVTQTCAGSCTKDSDCPDLSGCVCDLSAGECVTDFCPGLCNSNTDCQQLGADECVCFEGRPDGEIVAEGEFGFCDACRTAGESCEATSVCCGQLICEPNSQSPELGFCQRKPSPPRHCKKHGQACHSDHDCCAQGVCYKGKCGEKDTHCNNNGECARGYQCVGGPLAPSHRRCRKNGRRRRNRTTRKHG